MTTTEYVAHEVTTTVGRLLEQLDGMREDVAQINVEALLESGMPEDYLSEIHRCLGGLLGNVARARLATMVLAAMSTACSGDDSEESEE